MPGWMRPFGKTDQFFPPPDGVGRPRARRAARATVQIMADGGCEAPTDRLRLARSIRTAVHGPHSSDSRRRERIEFDPAPSSPSHLFEPEA